MNEQFIFELYKQYAPDVVITDKKLREIQDHYKGDAVSFTQDFNSQILKDSDVQLDPIKIGSLSQNISNIIKDTRAKNREEERLASEATYEPSFDYEIDEEDFDPTNAFDEELLTGDKTYQNDVGIIRNTFEPFGFKVEYVTTPVLSSTGKTDETSGIIITSPDGKQTKQIDFNKKAFESGANVVDPLKTQQELKDFFNNNVDKTSEQYVNQVQKLTTDFEQLAKDKHLATKLSDEELETINKTADNFNLFEKETPGIVSAPGVSMVLKHDDIIEEAKALLKANGIENPNQFQLEEAGRTLYQRREVAKLRNAKTDEFLNNLTPEQRAKYFAAEVAVTSAQAKDLAKESPKIEFDIKNFENDTDVKLLKNIRDSYDALTNTRQSMYFMSDDDRQNYEDLINVVNGKAHDLHVRIKDFDKQVELVDDVKDQIALSRRSYDLVQDFSESLAVMTKTMVPAVVTGLARLPLEYQLFAGINGASAKAALAKIDDFDKDYFEDLMKLKNRFQIAPEDLGESFSSGEKFLKTTSDVISQFIPLIGITALATKTGGAVGGRAAANIIPFMTMYGIGKGMKSQELSFENSLKPFSERMDAKEMALISSGHGLAEATFEYFTTIKALQRFGKFRNADSKVLGAAGKEFITDKYVWGSAGLTAFAEMMGEGATEITQNLIDGKPIFEGVDIAMYGGLLMGGGMQLASVLQGYTTAKLSDKETKAKFITDFKELDDINLEVESLETLNLLDPAVKKLYDEAIAKRDAKVASIAEAYKKQIMRTNLDDATLVQMLKREAQAEDLRAQDARNEELYKTGAIDKDEYIRRQNRIKEEAAIVELERDALLAGRKSTFRVLNNNGDKTDQQTYDNYIARAEEEGLSGEAAISRAEALYYTDTYKNILKEYKGKINEEGNLIKVMNMTKADALAWIKKRLDNNELNQLEHDELKSNILNGKQNGFKIPGIKMKNGITYAIGIEENAVNNRRSYTIPHEVTHAIFDTKLLEKESDYANVLREYARKNLPDVFSRIATVEDGEVAATFFEFFLQGNHKVEDHLSFFNALAKDSIDLNYANPAELIRWWNGFLERHSIESKTNRDKKPSAKAQSSVEDDPRGYARRRDKLNELVALSAEDVSVSLEDEDPEKKPVYTWNDEIANAVMNFAIDNKIFDTYILGKKWNYQNPKQFIQDVYRELSTGPARTYDPNKILDNKNRPDFFGWIMKNLRFNALDVSLESIKEKTEEGKTVDIEQARGIAAETGKTVEDFGFTQVAEKLGVTPKQLKALTDVLYNEIARYTEDITEGVTFDADVTPLYSQLNKRFAQATDANPGGGNWRAIAPLLKDLKAFIEGNTPTILTEVTNEYASKNIPQIIEKVIDGQRDKGFVPYPQWVGKKIARELKSETGKRSGPQLMRKIPSEIRKLINNPQPLVDIYMPGGKASQGKKEGLAIQLSQRLAREILQNDLLNFIKTGDLKNSPITERLQQTQGLSDRVIAEAEAAEIVRQGDKIKNSIEGSDFSKANIATLLDANSDIVDLIRVGTDVEAAVASVLRFGDKKLKKVAGYYKNAIRFYRMFKDLPGADALAILDIENFEQFAAEGFKDILSDRDIFSVYLKKKGFTNKTLKQIEESGVEVSRGVDKLWIKEKFKQLNNDPAKIFIYLTKFLAGHSSTASKIRDGRSQNYSSVGDHRNELLTKTLGIKVEQVGLKGFNIIYKGEPTFVSNDQYKLNAVTGRDEDMSKIIKYTYDQSNAEAAEQQEAFFEYLDFLHGQIGKKVGRTTYTKQDFIMALISQQSNPKTMLRRMAPVRWRFVGKHSGKIRYEHVIPAQYVLTYVAEMYLGNVTRATVNKLLTQYEVALIPRVMDDQIPMGSLMARSYKPGDPALANRYYTIKNFGKPNFFAVEDLKEGGRLGEAFTEESLRKLRAKNVIQNSVDNMSSQRFIVAMKRATDPNAKRKGASVIDFDDTLAETKSNVLYTLPNGTKGKIDATEFALRSEALEDEGAVFDFSEFSKVKAGKRGPFFNKAKALKDKFGNTDIFVLTARPQAAAPAIQKFLSGVGLDLKLENIVGLENGTPEAKADWITGKVAEGYNDILFADDAIKNTKAVADVLDMFNIGGKIYQARIKFSKEGATEETLNKILDENNPDSPVVGRDVDATEAKEKGKPGFWLTELFNFRSKINLVFIPPSAEDLKGLWDNHIAGKGKKGESDKVWFDEAILRPYARAERAMDRIKLNVRKQMSNLRKLYGKDFIERLYDIAIPEFTGMDAVRVYLFQKAGHDTPGISQEQFERLIEYVEANENIKKYAEDIYSILNDNIDTALYPGVTLYPPPTQYWKQQDVNSDIEFAFNIIREAIYNEFLDNRYTIFTDKMMNKIEAIYGTQFRRAMEDMFYRMEEGVNRNQSQINNPWIKWLNFATGNIMFVNIRSALLQSISATNFIELTGPNNLINTIARVMDRKQWVADFKTLWESEFLKNRRDRGKIDVVQEEIQRTLRSEKDPFLRLASLLQNKGYAPTRFMDSLAIAFGGAAYYRNLVNDYVSKGMNQVQAERTAMRDFREKAEASQQSSRADLISMEQASVAGRIFLTFQNVTMQYTRLGKKALVNLRQGRRIKNPDGTFKTLNESRAEYAWQILQFLAYQNLLFAGLQKAILLMFALGEADEVEEDKKVEYLNSVIDSILRGTGILGGVLSVAKNIGIELAKGNRRDLDVKVLEISPTISTKFRKAAKIINAIGKADRVDDLLIEVPSFLYGLPTDRVVRLIRQVEALTDLHDQGYKSYERILMGLGWSTYDFGLPYPPSIIDKVNELPYLVDFDNDGNIRRRAPRQRTPRQRTPRQRTPRQRTPRTR